MKKLITLSFLFISLVSTAQPVGDAKQITVSTAASNLIVTGSGFVIGDVGKTIIIHQAGAQGDELTATVTGYTSATELTLNAVAANTVTNAVAWMGTDNTPLLQAEIGSNKTVTLCSSGNYLFSGRVNLDNIKNFAVNGNGVTMLWVSANPNSYLTGTQPTKDLFRANYSEKIFFDRIAFKNIGQEQARTDTNSEGKYWTVLNGVSTPYSRHFNKTANTGAAVYNTGSKSVTVQNCEAVRVGCLYVTSGAATGCRIFNNHVKGYGSVAMFPGSNSVCSSNQIDNTESPALSGDDRAANLGTSHSHYITGGMDGILITNELVIGVKNTAIQFNTSSGLPVDNAIVSNINFKDCPGGWLFLGGNHSRIRVNFNTINLVNCGGGAIDQPNGEITLNNIKFENSNLTIVRSKLATVQGCRFKNLPTANVPGIFIIPKDGLEIIVRGCDFANTVDRAITIYGNTSTIGNILIMGCCFRSSNIAVGYNGVTPVAGSAHYVHVLDNDFWGEAVTAFYAVDCQQNRFHMSEGAYSITAWMQGGDVWDIANNLFIPEGNNLAINIAPATTQMVSIIRNDFGVGAWIGYGGKAFFQNIDNLFRP